MTRARKLVTPTAMKRVEITSSQCSILECCFVIPFDYYQANLWFNSYAAGG